jgi:molybdopterin/thiamine biosynthesis adenylyltransferase
MLSPEKLQQLNRLGEICLRIREPTIRKHYAENWSFEASRIKCSPVTSLPPLSIKEKERYSRQILFAGEGNQQRLKQAKIAVLGAGGVGAPCLYYLAGAGIGHIKIVDMDVVERSNLNRQIIFGERNLGQPKVEAAKARLVDLNSDINVETVRERVTPENARNLIHGHDFVIGAIDDVFVVNEACVRAGIPFAIPFATTSTFGGGLFVSGAGGRAPCYECVFNAHYNPKIGSDRTTGVFGFIPGVAGILAALEVVKHILDLPRQVGTLTVLDMWAGVVHTFPITPFKECIICGR